MRKQYALRVTGILLLFLALFLILAACKPIAKSPQASVIHSGMRNDIFVHNSINPKTNLSVCTAPSDALPPAGCSIFTVVKDGKVLFGGNDDYITYDSTYWIDPGTDDDYGVIWIGPPDDVQQGVNEKGLAYDANGLPEIELNPHRERTPHTGNINSPQIQILHECATVDEVIDWVKTHQVSPRMNDQKHFADATGDAVVISPGPDGELIFTRKAPGDGFLVSTNFNVANPNHAVSYPCWRYETAQDMLQQLVNEPKTLGAKDAADVLDAVHLYDIGGWTKASLVADLTDGLIYLYFYHQYDHPVTINIADELANPRAARTLSSLFPAEIQEEGERRFQRISTQASRCQRAGMVWAITTLASTGLLVGLTLSGKRTSEEYSAILLWSAVGITFGPVGLIIWLIWRRSKRRANWRYALIEAAGGITAPAVAYFILLYLDIYYPTLMNNALISLAVLFGISLAINWLVLTGILKKKSQAGFIQLLWARLPYTLVTTTLGLAAIQSVVPAMLGIIYLPNCSTFQTVDWAVGTIWAIVSASSLCGGFIIYLFQMWAVRKGLYAWSAVVEKHLAFQPGSWRTMWWWVLLSYIIFVAGLVTSEILKLLISA